MKCCTKCQESKPEEAFAFRSHRRNHTREARCKQCRKGHDQKWRKSRTAEDRRQEMARYMAKRGRPFKPTGERYWWKILGAGYGRAVNLTAHGWRQRDKRTNAHWVDRLRVELPHLYDPAMLPNSLAYRGRYHLDPAFKSRQIERAHKRRSEEEHGKFFSDGTLDGPAIRSLFSRARVCLYCGESMRSEQKTLDHVWARRLGGWHSITNAVICCYSCNSKKHGMSPTRWLKRVSPERQARVLKAWRTVGVVLTQPQLAS